MKKCINGRKYNTETALYLGMLDFTSATGDCNSFLRQVMYIKRNGEHFMHSFLVDGNTISNEEIRPMTGDQVRSWFRNNGAYA